MLTIVKAFSLLDLFCDARPRFGPNWSLLRSVVLPISRTSCMWGVISGEPRVRWRWTAIGRLRYRLSHGARQAAAGDGAGQAPDVAGAVITRAMDGTVPDDVQPLQSLKTDRVAS